MELVPVRRWDSDEGPGEDPDEGESSNPVLSLFCHTSEDKVRPQLDHLPARFCQS